MSMPPTTEEAKTVPFRAGDLVRNARYDDRDAYPAFGDCAYVQAIDGDYLDFGQGSKLLHSLFDLAAPRADSAERTAGAEVYETFRNDMRLLLESSVKADEAYTEMLSHRDWRPTRAHIEGARNAIRTAVNAGHLLLATPAPSSPGVPDSVRALSEAASPDWDTNDATPYILGPPLDGEIDRFEVIARGPHGHAKSGDAIRKWQANRMLAVYAVNRLRVEIAAHPAGQSTGQGAEGRNNASCAHTKIRAALVASMEARGANRQQAFFREAAARVPAPDSTRTGQVEEIARTAHNAYYGVTGSELWLAHPQSVRGAWERAILAARPAAPEAQGAWCFDMEAAPRDETPIDLWCFNRRFINYRWDTEGRVGGWWSDVRHKDRHWRDRECLMPASVSAWRLADAPPASSSQESA